MSTYTQIYYHLVYSTKNRVPLLRKDMRERLFKYTWGTLTNHKCHPYQIGGVEDHIHIFFYLHPTVCLADLIREMKTSSTRWLKREGIITSFPGWQDGYGAFTKSHQDREMIILYVQNQEEHHRHETFAEELRRLLEEEGIEFDEKYLL